MKQISLLVALVLALAGRVGAAESPLNGEYADDGTVASVADGTPGGTASFHALVSMEFEPSLARRLHEQADFFRVRYTEDRLVVEVVDHDGVPCKTGRWNIDAANAPAKDGVTLRFRVRDDENLLYRLEVAAEGRLLQLIIQREQAGTFGPVTKPVGTYLFPRLR